ncbi:DUF3710 domain-containing protein [Glutamicibacter halophytocola]
MIFKRKKTKEQEAPVESNEVSASSDEPKTGPYDINDVADTNEYLDFGSILIKPVSGLKVRMDVEESNKRVIAVSLEIAESRVQLMAFSSSKSESLWPGIKDKIKSDITAQNGEIFKRDGDYGEELLAKVPQQLPDGRAGHVALRFVGIDGPRWFLRAVIGGNAIANEEAAGNRGWDLARCHRQPRRQAIASRRIAALECAGKCSDPSSSGRRSA